MWRAFLCLNAVGLPFSQGSFSRNEANEGVRLARPVPAREQQAQQQVVDGAQGPMDTGMLLTSTASAVASMTHRKEAAHSSAHVKKLEERVKSLEAALEDRDRFIEELKDQVKAHAEERRRKLLAYRQNVSLHLRRCQSNRDALRDAAVAAIQEMQSLNATFSLAVAPPPSATNNSIASLLLKVTREQSHRSGSLQSQAAEAQELAVASERQVQSLQASLAEEKSKANHLRVIVGKLHSISKTESASLKSARARVTAVGQALAETRSALAAKQQELNATRATDMALSVREREAVRKQAAALHAAYAKIQSLNSSVAILNEALAKMHESDAEKLRVLDVEVDGLRRSLAVARQELEQKDEATRVMEKKVQATQKTLDALNETAIQAQEALRGENDIVQASRADLSNATLEFKLMKSAAVRANDMLRTFRTKLASHESETKEVLANDASETKLVASLNSTRATLEQELFKARSELKWFLNASKALRAKLMDTQKRVEASQAWQENLEQEVRELQAQKHSQDDQLNVTREALKSSIADLALARKEVKTQAHDMQGLRMLFGVAMQEINASRTAAKSLVSQAAEVVQHFKGAAVAIVHAEAKNAQKAIVQLQEELNTREAELGDLRSTLQREEARMSGLETQLQQRNGLISELGANATEAKRDRDALRSQLAAARNELDQTHSMLAARSQDLEEARQEAVKRSQDEARKLDVALSELGLLRSEVGKAAAADRPSPAKKVQLSLRAGHQKAWHAGNFVAPRRKYFG